jgi:hypothetical protein
VGLGDSELERQGGVTRELIESVGGEDRARVEPDVADEPHLHAAIAQRVDRAAGWGANRVPA